MARQPEKKDHPFTFERDTQRRSAGKAQYRPREVAQAERRVLLRRLEVSSEEEKLLEPLSDLLDRYCLEVPLNIRWYEEARRRAFSRLVLFNTLIVGIALAALGVTAWMLFHPRPPSATGGMSFAQLSITVAALLGAVQVLAAANDHKARVGIFWKAAADLKEQLYSFEESWRGKVVAGGKVAPDFETLVRQELKAARKIARDERTEFFNTYKSTQELVGIASSAWDTFRGKRRDELSAQREAESQAREATDTSARIAKARQSISEAAATVEAARYRLEELEKLKQAGHGGVTDDLLAQAQLEVVRAQSEKRRAEALLQAILRDDRPGPVGPESPA